MYGTTATAIKFYPRLGIYKNSTGNVTFDPKTMVATSYNWWDFVKVIKGKVVFNDYRYSVTTSAHQHLVKSVLRDLGIEIDVSVNISQSLTDAGLNDACRSIFYSIASHQVHLENPKRKKANDDFSHNAIKSLWNDFKVLKSLGARVKKSEYKSVLENARNNEKARLVRLSQDREARKVLLQRAKETLAASLEPQTLGV